MILVKAINEEVSFLKKKEAVFIGALLVISVVLCIFVYAVPHGTHGSIQIMVDGELYGTYSLAEDQVIQIGDTNVCEIKDGEVKIDVYKRQILHGLIKLVKWHRLSQIICIFFSI